MSQNVRSLARNGSKLEDLVKQTLPSVVALQEIWRGDIKIDGYSGTFLERDGRGGGVGFLFSEELTPSIHASHIDFNIEYLIIKIEKCFYASIYIPNRSNVEAALVTLKKEIRKINQNEIFLLGDFNTDLLREDHLANKFHAFMQELNTYPTISKPTRKKSYTLIDNILTNTSADISSGIIPTSISDHMTPFLAISKRNPIKPKKIKKRIFSPANIDNLKTLLRHEEWKLDSDSCEANYQSFNDKFMSNLDLCCPELEFEIRRDKTAMEPWYTKGLSISRKKKERFLKRIAQKKPHYNWEYIDKYITIYYKLCRIAKADHWAAFFQENFNNMKLIWNQTNKALGRGKTGKLLPKSFLVKGEEIKGDENIANAFNNFFISIGSELAEKFTETDDYRKHVQPSKYVFFFRKVTEEDISKIIKSLKNKGSSGFDGVSNMLIKKLHDELLTPLTTIVNDSLDSGHVPSQLKLAKVIPLFKSGDQKNLSNYRPISLLSVFSKILEKAIYHQTYFYFQKVLICKTQFGFRAGSETIHCILNFMNNISCASKDPFQVGIFVDLKKAFDTVNHKILLEKMKIYGFSEHCIKWFSSYLSNRKQITVFNGKKSKSRVVQIGVPQGSILGPLLFLIYINDLPNATELLLSLFADDTTLQASGKTIEEVESKINNELSVLSDWFETNQLTLHPNKTRYILFNSKGKELNLTLKGVKLKQIAESSDEPSFKFLGIHIDERLSWKHHCEFLHKKLIKVFYSLNRVKKVFPLKLKVQLFHSLFNSHIMYGIQIWGASPHANMVEKIQKRMIRSLLSRDSFVHTEPIRKKYEILTLTDLYAHRIALTMFKIEDLKGPPILQDIFKFKEKDKRNPYILQTVKSTSKISYQLPTYHIALTWNKLVTDKSMVFGRELNEYITYRSCYQSKQLYSKGIKTVLANKYQDKCQVKDCFICKEKDNDDK